MTKRKDNKRGDIMDKHTWERKNRKGEEMERKDGEGQEKGQKELGERQEGK